jgi:hypothetical protein
MFLNIFCLHPTIHAEMVPLGIDALIGSRSRGKPITSTDGSGVDTAFVECPNGRIGSELAIFDSEEATVASHPTKGAGIRFPQVPARSGAS